MYNKSILTNLGFNEKEIKAIINQNEEICKRIDNVKNKVKDLNLNLNQNVYEKLLNSIEHILLRFMFLNTYNPVLSRLNLFEIIKMDKDIFQKEFNLNKLYSWVPYHGYTRIESLSLIADSSDFLDFYNKVFDDDALKAIENKFGLKFDVELEFFEGEFDDHTENKFIKNPIKNNDEPLVLLTIYHYYQDGEPGYNCCDLKAKLYIVE